MTRLPLSCLAWALLASPLLAAPARAAESYDNCAGTVPSLPAVLDKQGVWCLTKDLATLLASGAAITVTKPNVTLDCNGFKLGGLGAGLGTATIGVEASGQSNFTVRGCNIRGFAVGVNIDDTSGGGHLVEDNRFDGNTVIAVNVFGDGSLIRRNQLLDTGSSTVDGAVRMAGIQAEGNADIIDNTVRVVDSQSDPSLYAYGIIVLNSDAGTVAGNRVSGVVADAATSSYGIRATGSGLSIRGNDLVGVEYGIYCSLTSNVALENTLRGFTTPVTTCTNGGNTVYP